MSVQGKKVQYVYDISIVYDFDLFQPQHGLIPSNMARMQDTKKTTYVWKPLRQLKRASVTQNISQGLQRQIGSGEGRDVQKIKSRK